MLDDAIAEAREIETKEKASVFKHDSGSEVDITPPAPVDESTKSESEDNLYI